jgi:hypothetical protein
LADWAAHPEHRALSTQAGVTIHFDEVKSEHNVAAHTRERAFVAFILSIIQVLNLKIKNNQHIGHHKYHKEQGHFHN